MGYRYIRDIHIEEPFYHTMAAKLKGIKCRETFYGSNTGTYSVECPCCKKRKARMGLSKKKDTFIFGCPNDTCSIYGVMTLHDLIKRFGGESMFNDWRKASWTTTYEENWFPIQNRVAYKDRAPRKKKTFKDKQELKSAALQIRMNG